MFDIIAELPESQKRDIDKLNLCTGFKSFNWFWTEKESKTTEILKCNEVYKQFYDAGINEEGLYGECVVEFCNFFEGLQVRSVSEVS
jgi:hypothetical protein